MARMAISGASGTMVRLEGREVVSFGGCNYLGLSFHPEVVEAMRRGLAEYGISTSASRETTGNTVVHDELENSIARFLGVESAVVVPDGYTGNLAAAQALAGVHRIAVIDSRCHRSIRESLACAGLEVVEYRHLDGADAADKVRRCGGAISVWTDGVFASDGSVAPVRLLADVCAETGATLVVDDCHGLFTIGRGGRGTLSHAGLEECPNAVITCTLAKGAGCHGGFVAGTRAMADRLRERSTAYICTTPVSPAIAAAGIKAFEVVMREPSLLERLRVNAATMLRGLRGVGLHCEDHGTPIFAFTLSTAAEMQRLCGHLLERGYLAPLIAYPDGPAPVYFRVSVSSLHTSEQIAGLCGEVGGALRGRAPAAATAGRGKCG